MSGCEQFRIHTVSAACFFMSKSPNLRRYCPPQDLKGSLHHRRHISILKVAWYSSSCGECGAEKVKHDFQIFPGGSSAEAEPDGTHAFFFRNSHGGKNRRERH
jgi:hypothetical protein